MDTRKKTYIKDDKFKAKARAHQFEYKENILKDFYSEKNPQVILSPESARKGLIFCNEYREMILEKTEKFGTSALFSNMLRSEHIPYNIFTPMEDDKVACASLFNEIIGDRISKVDKIIIEYPGKYSNDRERYLNDGTSFDAFIKYESKDGLTGGIGIEVKYTENSYRIGVKEKDDIEKQDGKYNQITTESNFFIPKLDIKSFIKANHLRQIWRNHILGYSMIKNGEIQIFHHIHLYPEGNTHFHEYALPEYQKLLTRKGKETFIPLTYERLFSLLTKYFHSERQSKWIEYLKERYLIK